MVVVLIGNCLIMELMTMIAANCAISIENARFSEAVRQAYRDVASMNRAKGKAINHLSHELKTPVAVLTGSLEILRKKTDPDRLIIN